MIKGANRLSQEKFYAVTEAIKSNVERVMGAGSRANARRLISEVVQFTVPEDAFDKALRLCKVEIPVERKQITPLKETLRKEIEAVREEARVSYERLRLSIATTDRDVLAIMNYLTTHVPNWKEYVNKQQSH